MSKVIKDLNHSVRRVLRRKYSREYFTGHGWTPHLDKARSYSDSIEAAQTCVRWGLDDVEMVLHVSGGSSDFFCTELWPRTDPQKTMKT